MAKKHKNKTLIFLTRGAAGDGWAEGAGDDCGAADGWAGDAGDDSAGASDIKNIKNR